MGYKIQTSFLPSLDMTSNSTNSSVTGSPGPSVRLEQTEYETMRNPNEAFSSLSASERKEIERLHRELEDAQQRIDRDTEVINNLHEKVTGLEELVRKQKITISTQSRTISDRRVLRKNQQQHQSPMGVFPMTPTHQPHMRQYQVPGSGASVASYTSGVASAASGGVYLVHQSPSPFDNQTPQSVSSIGLDSQCSTVFDQPPPKFEIPSGPPPPGYPSFLPSAPTKGKTQDVPDPMVIAISNISNLGISVDTPPTHDDYRKEMALFSTGFSRLMQLAEIFGQSHASLPNIFMDSHLDDRVKEYLIAISSRSQASVLIGNTATRGFLVAKAISYYLVRNILSTSVIKGFDRSIDLEVDEIEEVMVTQPAVGARHALLRAITTHLTTLSKRPNFTNLCQLKIQYHLHMLWRFIGPLSHDPSNQSGQVWTDLIQIITQAQSLAINMYSVPLEYRFEYVEQGEPFDPLTMINRDPYVHGDADTLKDGDTRVRLGVTPIVRIRNNAQSPGAVNLMYLGHVLLKTPKKQTDS
ncbi:hypothetical protein BJY01DRAFT_255371 [Aspergillus pseudoustus]|uniref:Uncharacterized protein n=1 Tax=Aspergillus pseudoustus TaxID=1810923 RepID=A0ABR4IKR5_9EURO